MGKTMENSYRRMVNMCLVLAELVEQDHETFPMESVLSQQIAFAGLLEMLGEDLLFILEPKNLNTRIKYE